MDLVKSIEEKLLTIVLKNNTSFCIFKITVDSEI